MRAISAQWRKGEFVNRHSSRCSVPRSRAACKRQCSAPHMAAARLSQCERQTGREEFHSLFQFCVAAHALAQGQLRCPRSTQVLALVETEVSTSPRTPQAAWRSYAVPSIAVPSSAVPSSAVPGSAVLSSKPHVAHTMLNLFAANDRGRFRVPPARAMRAGRGFSARYSARYSAPRKAGGARYGARLSAHRDTCTRRAARWR